MLLMKMAGMLDQPMQAEVVFRAEGGRIERWCTQIMKDADITAAKLVLHPGGLALPSYSDSTQIHYVLQGSGVVGVVFPGSEMEHVKRARHGDVVAIPRGSINWWCNEDIVTTDFVILSLGVTSNGHCRGEYTSFFLFGRGVCEMSMNGLVHGFSAEFLSHAWDLDDATVMNIVESQMGVAIVKPSEALHFPDSIINGEMIDDTGGYDEFVYNVVDAEPDTDVKNGGRVVVLTSEKLPFLRKLALGADLVKLDPGAMCSPGFSSDGAYQVTYIVRGSGRVQVVGNGGIRVIDTELKEGDFFIVPPFFIVSKIAGPEGMEWFSIITSENPVFANLGGKTSVLKSLSPQVMSAALNISKEREEMLRDRRTNDAVFFPPRS